MNKPIVTWDDLTDEEESKFIHIMSGEYTYIEIFKEVSCFIQQKLAEKGLLVQNPVEDWSKEEKDAMYDLLELHTGESGLDHVIKKLTSPPDPEEKMVYISWDKEWPSNIMVNFGAGICDYSFNVPESLAKEVGFFVSDWNAARESGKLNGYEVKES